MDPISFQRPLAASDVPFDRIAGNAQLSDEQKVNEATRQFEAILLRQILESAQKNVLGPPSTENATASGIYRDMVTNQLADNISKSGSLGLSKMLMHDLTRQLHSVSAGNDRQTEALPTAHAHAEVARPLFDSTPPRAVASNHDAPVKAAALITTSTIP